MEGMAEDSEGLVVDTVSCIGIVKNNFVLI